MIKFFKKLKWLIKNQEKIKSILEKPVDDKSKEDPRYSLAGVPDYQLDYIDKVLKEDKTI